MKLIQLVGLRAVVKGVIASAFAVTKKKKSKPFFIINDSQALQEDAWSCGGFVAWYLISKILQLSTGNGNVKYPPIIKCPYYENGKQKQGKFKLQKKKKNSYILIGYKRHVNETVNAIMDAISTASKKWIKFYNEINLLNKTFSQAFIFYAVSADWSKIQQIICWKLW